MEYSIFYRRCIHVDHLAKELGQFDVFISAYNSSDRVKIAFDSISAQQKIWLIHPEYQYAQIEHPVGHTVVAPLMGDEVSQIDNLLAAVPNINAISLCIDITGFMRNSLAFLIPKLAHLGVKSFVAIYSEPISYSKQEATLFTTTTHNPLKIINEIGRAHV